MKENSYVYRIAVAGNPNSGKTCIFNNLTGGKQHVANYPGVTVEFFEGSTKFEDIEIRIIDLPGTYSLTAYSQDEIVARDFILHEKPDAIIDVVDASNLERNLYLTVQLLELNLPVIIALNMIDIAEQKGYTVNARILGEIFGIKAIPTVAVKKQGMDELKKACIQVIREKSRPHSLTYSHELQGAIEPLEKVISTIPDLATKYPSKWLAVKLIESDEYIIKIIKESGYYNKIEPALQKAMDFIRIHSQEEPRTAAVEARYAIATGAVRKCVTYTQKKKRLFTEKIDAVLCNRITGPIILLAVVYTVFNVVFQLADGIRWIPLLNGTWLTPTKFCELLFQHLSNSVDKFISEPLLASLVKDGIIGGVGSVLTFVPLIFFMFLFIAILEDTGYVARIAFILDRLLRIFGLQGKSILAMIISGGLGCGGCAVPGILATRTLREEKDRLITILVSPMMNCGAKLPVYAMLIAAFFPSDKGVMMFLLWILSWIFALFSAFIIRKWLLKGEQTPFVLELPVYHLPTLRGVLIHTWYRTWMFIKKAGTVILGISLLFWFLMYFPRYIPPKNGNTKIHKLSENEIQQRQLEFSFAGKLGKLFVPLSKLAGFSWKDNIALIGGFAAKEVIIGTMGTTYAMGNNKNLHVDSSLSSQLHKDKSWSKLKAFCFMIFVMLYAPCIATIAAIQKETGSWKWTLFSLIYPTLLAFIITVIVYRVGLILS